MTSYVKITNVHWYRHI